MSPRLRSHRLPTRAQLTGEPAALSDLEAVPSGRQARRRRWSTPWNGWRRIPRQGHRLPTAGLSIVSLEAKWL